MRNDRAYTKVAEEFAAVYAQRHADLNSGITVMMQRENKGHWLLMGKQGGKSACISCGSLCGDGGHHFNVIIDDVHRPLYILVCSNCKPGFDRDRATQAAAYKKSVN